MNIMISYINMFTTLMKDMIFYRAIAELLSQYIIVGSSCGYFKSESTLLIHISWQAIDVAATYSASADDSVTIGCFFYAQEIASDPKWKICPEVLLLSSKLPSQSLSV